jgi:WD40 repeat protein
MRESTVFEAHGSYVLDLLFSPDDQILVSAGMDNVVKLWSLPDWKLVRAFKGHANSVNSMSLSPDGKSLVTGSTDQTVKLWSFPDGLALHTLQDRKKTVSAVAFSPDGQSIAAGSYGGRAVVWTLAGEEVVGIKANRGNLGSVAFSPDGRILATSGLGNEIGLWSLPGGEPVGILSGHETAVGSLSFIQGGRYLVSLGYEQVVKFWDTETWREARTVHSDVTGVRRMVFAPDEQIAALSMEGRVQVYSVEDWELRAELPVSTKAVNGMAFTSDGQRLAVGAADGKIRIWEL